MQAVKSAKRQKCQQSKTTTAAMLEISKTRPRNVKYLRCWKYERKEMLVMELIQPIWTLYIINPKLKLFSYSMT